MTVWMTKSIWSSSSISTGRTGASVYMNWWWEDQIPSAWYSPWLCSEPQVLKKAPITDNTSWCFQTMWYSAVEDHWLRLTEPRIDLPVVFHRFFKWPNHGQTSEDPQLGFPNSSRVMSSSGICRVFCLALGPKIICTTTSKSDPKQKAVTNQDKSQFVSFWGASLSLYIYIYIYHSLSLSLPIYR